MRKHLLGLLCLAVAGCGGGDGSVSGKVKFKGEPVKHGTVMFYAQDRMYQGEIKPDGTYQVEHVPSGPVKIAVYVPPPSKALLPDNPNVKATVPANAPPEIRAAYARAKKVGKEAANEPQITVPQKYMSPEKSGIQYDVKPGPQTKDLQLRP